MEGLDRLRRVEEAIRTVVAVLANLVDDQQPVSPPEREAAIPEDDAPWLDAARWRPPPKPEAWVSVFWCPSCGRRFPIGQLPGPTHYRQHRYGRRRCEERPRELVYRLNEGTDPAEGTRGGAVGHSMVRYEASGWHDQRTDCSARMHVLFSE